MKIVGLSGSIGSGKTTFADYMTEAIKPSGHWESWQLVAEVAEQLKGQRMKLPLPDDTAAVSRWLECLPEIIRNVCHRDVTSGQLRLTREDLADAPLRYTKLRRYLEIIQAEPSLNSVRIDTESKETFRPLLQWLGGYLAATCGGDIWYSEIINRIKRSRDLELAVVGGVRFPADAECIRGVGGSIVAIVRPGLSARDEQDPTERERGGIVPDATVHNDGGLEELRRCAQRVTADIAHGQLHPTYHSTGS